MIMYVEFVLYDLFAIGIHESDSRANYKSDAVPGCPVAY